VSGVPSDRLTLSAIRAEEEQYVADTIARVRRAQAGEAGRGERDAARKRTLMKALAAWGIWQAAGPLFWLLLFSRRWSAVGKDYRFEGLPDYVRELPAERSPAIVQSLLREGRTVTPAVFTATIFDLARRGFLAIRPGGYQVSHELLRRVVYDDLPLSRRLDLHRRVALAVEARRPDEVELLAHHFATACMPDRAADYLERAADRALAVRAYDTASFHLARAAAALEQIGAPAARQFRVAARQEEVLDVLARRAEQESRRQKAQGVDVRAAAQQRRV